MNANDAFTAQPFTINNYRPSLFNTFTQELRDALTANGEVGSAWHYHHTYEVGSHQNDQILARRLYDSNLRVNGQRINVHAPGNVVLVPQSVHADINRLNRAWWQQQMQANNWRTIQDAYRNVNLQEYVNFQNGLKAQYSRYTIGNGGNIANLNKVRRALGLPAYNPARGATNASVGSAVARGRWARDRGAALARWGRRARIAIGAIAILGTLASGVATANQIANPNEATQTALDMLLLRYEQALEVRLRGDGLRPEGAPYLRLMEATDAYLAAIQMPDLVRAQVRYQMIGLAD